MKNEKKEELIWEGGPSHWKNFGPYLLCGLTCWLVIPAVIGIRKFLELRSKRYELTTQRLKLSTGVFSRETDELELYRVKDGRVHEPFLLRLLGLGNVHLITSDRTHPEVVLVAVPDPRGLWDKIRGSVESLRDAKGLRDVDVNESHAR